MAGLNTCLVIHNQDTTAHYLLNCKIGISHVTCGKNLSAVRLETTKVCIAFSFSFLSINHIVYFHLVSKEFVYWSTSADASWAFKTSEASRCPT